MHFIKSFGKKKFIVRQSLSSVILCSVSLQLEHFGNKVLSDRVVFSACGICYIDRQMLTSVTNERHFYKNISNKICVVKKFNLFTRSIFNSRLCFCATPKPDRSCYHNIFGDFTPVSKINGPTRERGTAGACNLMHENNWMVMNSTQKIWKSTCKQQFNKLEKKCIAFWDIRFIVFMFMAPHVDEAHKKCSSALTRLFEMLDERATETATERVRARWKCENERELERTCESEREAEREHSEGMRRQNRQ